MRTILIASFVLLSTMFGVNAANITVDGKEVDAPVCGGLAQYECKDTEWCDYPAEAACGMADMFGTCRKKPTICTQEEEPVCGCDGKNYGNPCKANAAGTDVAGPGKCAKNKM